MAQIDLAIRGVITHRDGTITLANTSQRILTGTDRLSYLFLQNPSAQGESLFFNIGQSASVTGNDSWELLPGSSFERFVPGWMPVEDIFVAAATPGHPFVFKTV